MIRRFISTAALVGCAAVYAMAYTAAPERATFTRITAGGLRESHVHDIVMTEEPTNYQPIS